MHFAPVVLPVVLYELMEESRILTNIRPLISHRRRENGLALEETAKGKQGTLLRGFVELKSEHVLVHSTIDRLHYFAYYASCEPCDVNLRVACEKTQYEKDSNVSLLE